MRIIYIVFSKRIASLFQTPNYSRIYVCAPIQLIGVTTGVISFDFIPNIIQETRETIICAFPDDGITTVRFYSINEFSPTNITISNDILKASVEGYRYI